MKKNLVDLHTHSVASNHAFSSATENFEYAASIGLKVYGLSEHQHDIFGVGANPLVFGGLWDNAPKQIGDTKILIGIEANITDEGIDLLLPKTFNKFSYLIASMHSYVYDPNKHDYDSNTKNYLNVMDNKDVKILGHIDDGYFPCDYEQVVKKAKDKHILIEINNSSLKPNGFRLNSRENYKTVLSLCEKYDCPIIMNSDAHIKYKIGNLEYSQQLLDEVNFPDRLVLNYDLALFEKYFTYR